MEMDPEADTGWPVNCNVDSNDGYKNVGRLGIAFFQKKCLVKKCEKRRGFNGGRVGGSLEHPIAQLDFFRLFDL